MPLLGEAEPHAVLAAGVAAGTREVVLKGGPDGCWVRDGGKVRHVPTVAVDVEDPVGAGDAFAGGYLAGRLAGVRPLEAARLGTRLAAGVIAAPGDTIGLPSPAEAAALLSAAGRLAAAE